MSKFDTSHDSLLFLLFPAKDIINYAIKYLLRINEVGKHECRRFSSLVVHVASVAAVVHVAR